MRAPSWPRPKKLEEARRQLYRYTRAIFAPNPLRASVAVVFCGQNCFFNPTEKDVL